jgi:hypothetical protein
VTRKIASVNLAYFRYYQRTSDGLHMTRFAEKLRMTLHWETHCSLRKLAIEQRNHGESKGQAQQFRIGLTATTVLAGNENVNLPGLLMRPETVPLPSSSSRRGAQLTATMPMTSMLRFRRVYLGGAHN